MDNTFFVEMNIKFGPSGLFGFWGVEDNAVRNLSSSNFLVNVSKKLKDVEQGNFRLL